MTDKRQELAQKLKSESFDADWSMLEEHYQRGALIHIDHSLDLFETAAAIALDESSYIKELMEKKKIIKIDESMASQFKKEKGLKQFQFTIVQPYVLIQTKKIH